MGVGPPQVAERRGDRHPARGLPRRLQRRLGAGVLASAFGLASGTATADPTKEECMNANEFAQSLRLSRRLRKAEDELTVCVARSCPELVRNDCSERLNEVQRAMPTVVFAVRSARGEGLTAVRVLVDGAPLAETLDGSAIEVDPGAHQFTFLADGYEPFEQETLVWEGQKERSLPVVLQARPGPPAPPPRSAPRGGGDGASTTRRWIAVVASGLGVVTVGVGGVLALSAKSEFDNAERETGGARHDDSITAVHTGNVATVVMSAGGLLAVGGLVLWLTTPAPSVQVGTASNQVFVKATFQ
jgi:hypothetical protein